MVIRNDRFGKEADSLALAVHLDELSRAIAWLEALADRDGWPERTRFTLQLSLEEALANVISYGFTEGGDARAIISLDYERAPTMARLRLTDNGVAFDPTEREEAPPPESVEHADIGGHGVRIMRNLLDEFSYCQVDGNNQLILGSQLPKLAEPSRPT